MPGEEAARQRAHVLAWYGRFCQEEGKHRRAMQWCGRAVAEATEAGEPEALANALKVLDWARMDLGLLQDPSDWHRALGLFEEIGDAPSAASMLNMLGGFAYWRGRWTEAVDYYGQAQDRVLRTGNAVMDAFCRNNLAEIALDQGRLEESERLFHEALHIWRAAEYQSVIASATCNLARLASARGAFDEALGPVRRGRRRWPTTSAGRPRCARSRPGRPNACSWPGTPTRAMGIAEDCLEHLRTADGVPPQVPLWSGSAAWSCSTGVLSTRLGPPSGAAWHAARARDANYEVALTLKALAESNATARADTDALAPPARATLHPGRPRGGVDAGHGPRAVLTVSGAGPLRSGSPPCGAHLPGRATGNCWRKARSGYDVSRQARARPRRGAAGQVEHRPELAEVVARAR